MTTYKIEFSVCGKVLASNTITATNNIINYAIPQDITLMPIVGSVVGVQVIGNNGENIIKSPIVEAYVGSSLQDSTVVASDSPSDIEAQIEQLMTAKHTHDNKPVLDKFAEGDNGEPTYNGIAIGSGGTGGANDFIIKMTVEANGDNYTVTACDKTMEQIDAAVTSGQNIKAIAFDKYIMPLIQMQYSESYTFGAFLGSFLVAANVAKNPESGTDDWQFYLEPILADIVGYSNAALPNISTVGGALDELVTKSHTHATGSNITLTDNTEYRLIDVTTLTLTYPTSDFECWMRLTFAESGTITVTFPTDTKYIGTAPDFKNGETWELSFKDKVLAAQKVGEGT